jgi:hypothetical protein
MSDPPYYTACPNPFLEEFVRHYGKPYDPSVKYSREPQTIDVSVGETDALYKATRVPHQGAALWPSCRPSCTTRNRATSCWTVSVASGMTGVAAQWCGSAPAAVPARAGNGVEEARQGRARKWGWRQVVLNDLSPAGDISSPRTTTCRSTSRHSPTGKYCLKEVEKEFGWMYGATHTDGKTKGKIEYTVWSEVFTCPECAGEVNFLTKLGIEANEFWTNLAVRTAERG